MESVLNKITIKKILSIILVIAIMIVIFLFSSEMGDESTGTSSTVIKSAILLFNSNISQSNLDKLVIVLQPYIRKLAHFTLYALIGMFACNLAHKYSDDRKKMIIYSLSFAVLYAVSDEVHQIFVPGRAGRLYDVFIDSCGAMVGIFAYILLLHMKENIKEQIKIRKEG